MLKVLFLAIIIGATVIWTARAKNSESECKEELEQELNKYLKSESWQQLFTRHLKFIVNQSNDIFSEKKLVKLKTIEIIHNTINGCNHESDDEINDHPNIYSGGIKSCKHGKNIRSAMFRTARCSFVESSVKHIVLSDALLDKFPSDKLGHMYEIDKSIREFGETIVNILATLAHGEIGGLGELMAMNLYLNNKFNTVFLHKIPVEPMTSVDDLKVAQNHMRDIHNTLLDKLYTFWDVWCGDKNIVEQYQLKYKNKAYLVILDEMKGNMMNANDLVRSLDVSGNVNDFIDFDPNKIALTDFVNGLVSSRSMPPELSVDLQLRSFEASFEFNPQFLHEYHNDVFKTIYTSFYWTTISHLRLGVQILNQFERFEIVDNNWKFLVKFIKFIRPLTVFNINQVYFVPRLSPAASKNITKLLSFLLKLHYDLKKIININNVLFTARPEMQMFIKLLSTDMETMLNTEAPVNYYDNIDFDRALEIMQSNYQSFARLVSATSNYNEDKLNLNKLKRLLLFLSETINVNEI